MRGRAEGAPRAHAGAGGGATGPWGLTLNILVQVLHEIVQAPDQHLAARVVAFLQGGAGYAGGSRA